MDDGYAACGVSNFFLNRRGEQQNDEQEKASPHYTP
jgi:hypothetical protein